MSVVARARVRGHDLARVLVPGAAHRVLLVLALGRLLLLLRRRLRLIRHRLPLARVTVFWRQTAALDGWVACPRCRCDLRRGSGRADCPACGFVASAQSAPTAS